MSPPPTNANANLGKRKRDSDISYIVNEPAFPDATGLEAELNMPPTVGDCEPQNFSDLKLDHRTMQAIIDM